MSSPDQEKSDPSNRETPEEEHVGRRTWLASAVSAMGVTAAGLIAPSLLPAAEQNDTDPTRVPGHGPSPYGSRARGETSQRLTTATHSLTPHQSLHGIITPSALHFERHHNGVPMIDPDRHRVLIHGLVERPLTLSLHDLTRFPSVTRALFIECSGNSGKERKGVGGEDGPRDAWAHEHQ
jgi:sulfane dehydrogenase subunit SoxC